MKPKPLSQLEQEIMRIVWDLKNCRARDIVDHLGRKRKRKLAYTTIATILQRLHDKGLVVRRVKEGVYHYRPALSRKEYSKSLVTAFLNKLINSFGDTAIVSFAESIDSLPKKKREYFLRLLEGKDE